MKIEKDKMRIGDVAKKLKIKQFVIRYWQKEFNLEAERSTGGQRFYTPEDIVQFQKIKELLYIKGYTIAGAKKYFQKQATKNSIYEPIFPASLAEQNTRITPAQVYLDEELLEKIVTLQKKLLRLQELL